MFVCANCLKEFVDENPAYVLLHENRLNHPARYYFERRFHSLECLEGEVARLIPSYGPFVVFEGNSEGHEPITPHPMRAGELLAWLRTRAQVAR